MARALEQQIARGLPARKGFQEWALRIYLEQPSGNARNKKSRGVSLSGRVFKSVESSRITSGLPIFRPGGMREAIRRPWLARGHGVLDHPSSFPPPILEVLPDLTCSYTPPKGSPSARTFRRSTALCSPPIALTPVFVNFMICSRFPTFSKNTKHC